MWCSTALTSWTSWLWESSLRVLPGRLLHFMSVLLKHLRKSEIAQLFCECENVVSASVLRAQRVRLLSPTSNLWNEMKSTLNTVSTKYCIGDIERGLRLVKHEELNRAITQCLFNWLLVLRIVHQLEQASCSLSFSGSGSRSDSSFKMNNFWTISHYLFKKTSMLYTLAW